MKRILKCKKKKGKFQPRLADNYILFQKLPRAFPQQTVNYYQIDIEHLEKLQANRFISQALQFTNKMNGNIKRYVFRLFF